MKCDALWSDCLEFQTLAVGVTPCDLGSQGVTPSEVLILDLVYFNLSMNINRVFLRISAFGMIMVLFEPEIGCV